MFKLNICYLFSFSLGLEPLFKSEQDIDLPQIEKESVASFLTIFW